MSGEFRLNYSTPDINKTLNQIEAWDGKTRLRVEKEIKNSTRRIARGTRQRAPVDTGLMKRSIRTGFKSRDGVGLVKVKQPYAHLVELGAKGGYVVKPKKKKALRLTDRWVMRFAKKVVIPRRRARPFLRPAFDADAPDLANKLKKAVEKE